MKNLFSSMAECVISDVCLTYNMHICKPCSAQYIWHHGLARQVKVKDILGFVRRTDYNYDKIEVCVSTRDIFILRELAHERKIYDLISLFIQHLDISHSPLHLCSSKTKLNKRYIIYK